MKMKMKRSMILGTSIAFKMKSWTKLPLSPKPERGRVLTGVRQFLCIVCKLEWHVLCMDQGGLQGVVIWYTFMRVGMGAFVFVFVFVFGFEC
eukprot:scaffold26645_cov150-Skeletonema_menzelii.AAC.16